VTPGDQREDELRRSHRGHVLSSVLSRLGASGRRLGQAAGRAAFGRCFCGNPSTRVLPPRTRVRPRAAARCPPDDTPQQHRARQPQQSGPTGMPAFHNAEVLDISADDEGAPGAPARGTSAGVPGASGAVAPAPMRSAAERLCRPWRAPRRLTRSGDGAACQSHHARSRRRRARRFYDALGWRTKAAPEDDIVFFQAGGFIVALWGRAELAQDSGMRDNGGWGGVTLAQCSFAARSRRARGRCARCRGADHTGAGRDLLGRLLGSLRRSRRPSMGSRAQSPLDAS